MPFKSKSQVRACYAKNARGEAKGWDCKEWADKTKSIKKLPEKTAEFYCNIMLDSFTKVAKRLFDSRVSPVIPKEVMDSKLTAPAVTNSIARRVKNVSDRKPVTPQNMTKRS